MSLQQLLSSLLPAAVGINLVEMINKRVLVAVVVIGKGDALISLCSLMELTPTDYYTWATVEGSTEIMTVLFCIALASSHF